MVATVVLAASPIQAGYLGSCTIMVMRGGRLAPSPELSALESRSPGGASGLAQVKAEASGAVLTLACAVGLPTNCARVSLVHPTSFSAAPAGSGDTTFSGRLDLISGTSPLLLRREVDDVVILNGTYEFSIDLTAHKSAGVFASGIYEAVETIRCE